MKVQWAQIFQIFQEKLRIGFHVKSFNILKMLTNNSHFKRNTVKNKLNISQAKLEMSVPSLWPLVLFSSFYKSQGNIDSENGSDFLTHVGKVTKPGLELRPADSYLRQMILSLCLVSTMYGILRYGFCLLFSCGWAIISCFFVCLVIFFCWKLGSLNITVW